jgi:thiamine-phosphate pyrophosphorylase
MSLAVDYIGIGPIYATQTKQSENKPVGPDLIRWVKQFVPLPVVAIGGLGERQFAEVMGAGADNIAVIRELMSSDDITGRTRHLIQVLEAARKLPENA